MHFRGTDGFGEHEPLCWTAWSVREPTARPEAISENKKQEQGRSEDHGPHDRPGELLRWVGGPKWEGGQAPHAVSFLTPEAWESWNSISSGRQESGADTFRPAHPLFVLAEGFTGLFEADSMSANLEESGQGSQRQELKGPQMGN